ncbi:MAG: hypothetical protein AAGJ08_04915 [Cyanobacteria bacterium P01_H01_bin.35]
MKYSVGWVERNETQHSRGVVLGFTVVLPNLHDYFGQKILL